MKQVRLKPPSLAESSDHRPEQEQSQFVGRGGWGWGRGGGNAC